LADDIAKEAREAIQQSYDYDRENRREMVEDLRFIAGFQWNDAARAERRGRPMITINRSQQFLRQVSNPIRQNMPVLKCETDGQTDDTQIKPEIVNGLLRRIQYNSSAAHVYAQAVEHAVGCGIGWFRVATEYYDEESFDLDICIKRVFNPLTVYPDPGAMEPDRSDMKWCLVSEPMPVEAFKKKYPKASLTGMDTPSNGASQSSITWGTGDWVRVAEYWKISDTEDEIFLLKTGDTVRKSTLNKDQIAFLKTNGIIENSRPAKSQKVSMTLVSGQEELEDAYDFPCKFIPIIPVIGGEVPLDNGVYRHGIIRFQREPQQLNNYFLSVAAEALGQQPKSPWLVTQKMIGKFKGLWDNANREATPYLPYEVDPSAPTQRPERMQPPPLPTGLVQFAQMMQEDMKAATGIYDAALGNRSNETSGVAIAARQEQGTQATFHYVDNLEHSLEHLGRMLLDMMPKVYDTPRTMKLQTDDDREKEVTINQELMRFGGMPIRNNDVTRMKYNSVRVVLGPSYASRRQEAVQLLTQLVTAMPQVGAVAGDLIAKNLDFDGAEQLAERLRLLLPPQIMQMENPEQEQAMQPPPDPMAEMQAKTGQALMQIEVQTAESKAEQEKAKAEEARAKAEGAKLENQRRMRDLTAPPMEEQGTEAEVEEPEAPDTNAQLMQMMQAIMTAMTAPKIIVRDEAGRPMGVQTVMTNG
jgi:hypothetical protein